MILGASAICDRHDVIPTAIEEAGGTVIYFGMPVDPEFAFRRGRSNKSDRVTRLFSVTRNEWFGFGSRQTDGRI